MFVCAWVTSENTHYGGRITLWIVSSLIGFALTKEGNLLLFLCTWARSYTHFGLWFAVLNFTSIRALKTWNHHGIQIGSEIQLKNLKIKLYYYTVWWYSDFSWWFLFFSTTSLDFWRNKIVFMLNNWLPKHDKLFYFLVVVSLWQTVPKKRKCATIWSRLPDEETEFW